MKKILASLFIFASFVAGAQPQVPIGEGANGDTYRIQKDSFYTNPDKMGSETWGLTVELVRQGAKSASEHANYAMRARDCKSSGSFEMLQLDDYGAQTISKETGTMNGSDVAGTIAALICDWGQQVKANPDMNKNSIQSLTTYASFAQDPLWTKDAVIRTGNDRATLAILTESMKFEEVYVSVIGKIRYPAKTTDYIKIYVDRNECKAGAGVIVVKSLRAEPMRAQEFNFKNMPTANPEDKEYFKVALSMCEYTMENFKFKEVIRLEDYNRPLDTGKTVLEQMYGPDSKK